MHDISSPSELTKSLVRLHRRTLLQGTACGFGALAAGALAQGQAFARPSHPASIGASLHHPARAKRIIFLFMQGGVSQVDSFDYKPELGKRDGQSMPFDDARTLAKSGRRGTPQRLMKSPWQFSQYGDSGRWVSELFPCVGKHVDDLCFLHGMHTNGVAHGPATLFLHCGSTNFVRPSIGSWLYYALGAENDSLPGFVTIGPPQGNGGARNYGNAFLPARFQGMPIGSAGRDALEISCIERAGVSQHQQASQVQLIQRLNQQQLEQHAVHHDEWEAVIQSYETAWRMQQIAPELMDFSSESAQTQAMYGLDRAETQGYGRKCLLARRLCEAGVRFIQVNYGDNSANPAWDQHSNLPKHAEHALAVDQPISALLTDLKARGLLDDTIVWWGGEFGRTPYAQSNGTGRDHNPRGFTVWLAGGGFKPGYAHGETDPFGFTGVRGKVHMHDLHATLLHQLGLDHQRLTYSHAGRDFRLTDVYGRVIKEVLAS